MSFSFLINAGPKTVTAPFDVDHDGKGDPVTISTRDFDNDGRIDYKSTTFIAPNDKADKGEPYHTYTLIEEAHEQQVDGKDAYRWGAGSRYTLLDENGNTVFKYTMGEDYRMQGEEGAPDITQITSTYSPKSGPFSRVDLTSGTLQSGSFVPTAELKAGARISVYSHDNPVTPMQYEVEGDGTFFKPYTFKPLDGAPELSNEESATIRESMESGVKTTHYSNEVRVGNFKIDLPYYTYNDDYHYGSVHEVSHIDLSRPRNVASIYTPTDPDGSGPYGYEMGLYGSYSQGDVKVGFVPEHETIPVGDLMPDKVRGDQGTNVSFTLQAPKETWLGDIFGNPANSQEFKDAGLIPGMYYKGVVNGDRFELIADNGSKISLSTAQMHQFFKGASVDIERS